MGQAAVAEKFTAADFLAWDEGQRERHEYVDGEVFAMAGVEDRHATVTLNVAIALRQHLRGTPCRVFATDVKLRVEAANAFFYPDVFVTCSDADRARSLIKRDAVLVVEVLSPSTAGYDRGDKLARYRQAPSLQEVVLIDVDARRCDVFRRGEAEVWTLRSMGDDTPLQLASVDLSIPAAELYAELDDAPSAAQQQ